MTTSNSTINSRIRDAVKSIKATYDEIAEKTGISRSTLIRMMEEGTDVKIGNVESLSSKYDIDKDYILTGREELKSVTPVSQTVSPVRHFEEEESLHSNADSANVGNQVNEEKQKYEEFRASAPKGTHAAKLKEEDYDNPLVILDAAVSDLKRDWDGQVRGWPLEERMKFLKDALGIINRISAKYLSKMEDQD